MNFTVDSSIISVETALQNIRFLEKKQNIIMPGEFTKIMYSVDILTMNGIYVLCPLKCCIEKTTKYVSSHPQNLSYNKYMIWFQPNSAENYDVINYFRSFEYQLILQYLKHNELYNMSSNREKSQHKTCIYALSNQLSMGCTKVCRDFVGEEIDSIFSSIKKREIHMNPDIRTSNTNLGSKIVYAIKISGIWETSNEIGITYKFIEMNSPVSCNNKTSA
jgi:hypothetical protein